MKARGIERQRLSGSDRQTRDRSLDLRSLELDWIWKMHGPHTVKHCIFGTVVYGGRHGYNGHQVQL
jgi:hypothetical protein